MAADSSAYGKQEGQLRLPEVSSGTVPDNQSLLAALAAKPRRGTGNYYLDLIIAFLTPQQPLFCTTSSLPVFPRTLVTLEDPRLMGWIHFCPLCPLPTLPDDRQGQAAASLPIPGRHELINDPGFLVAIIISP